MIKINYYLAHWFASSKDKVIPGTSFLFLNQVSFWIASLYVLAVSVLPFKLSPLIITILLMSIVLGVIYGFQKKIEEYVYKQKYSEELKNLSSKKLYKMRAIGLITFITSFALFFIIAVISFRGYFK